MANFAKPTSASWVGPNGFNDGARIQVRGTSNYYIYIGGSFTNYRYWYKGRLSGSSGYVTLDAYPEKSSLELQIVLCDTYYDTAITVGSASYVYYLDLPKYAATVYYKGLSSSELLNSLDNPNLRSECTLVGWNLIGASTDSSRNGIYDAHMEFLNSWATANRQTLYCIYSQEGETSTSTRYYYRGNSTRRSVTAYEEKETSYIYGKGVYEEGDVSTTYGSVTTSCAADSTYEFQGWATEDGTTNFYYTDYKQAYGAGYTTLYGVYKKQEQMVYYPQNGGTTVSSSSSSTNYYYGTGTKTNNIPTEPSLSYADHILLGWSTTSSGSYKTWVEQWNNNVRTVYAIWQDTSSDDNNVYVGVNNKWVKGTVYYGVNGAWKQCIVKIGSKGEWK